MATTPLPSTGAVSGLGETLAFFTQADFAQRRFHAHGDVFETKLLAQRMVFIRGERAIGDLIGQSDSSRAGGLRVCGNCWAANRWPTEQAPATKHGGEWWGNCSPAQRWRATPRRFSSWWRSSARS